MPFTSNGSARIHWQERGSGDPLLLVMGHVFTGDLWYPVIPTLSERYRVIWFDNRGVGQSQATKSTSVADLSGDAFAVMDAAGIDSAHVFGVSMGGGIAMEMAVQAPERVRSLVLGCTAISAGLPKRSRLSFLGYYVPFRFVRRAMRQSLYGSAVDPAAAEKDLDVLQAMKYSRRGVINQAKAMNDYELPLETAATIKAPALVLHGDEDKTVSIELGRQIAETLPNATLICYPGAGHNFIVTYTDKVLDDVTSFLERAAAVGQPG
jgi:3-oxoadipate enol-lactonase